MVPTWLFSFLENDSVLRTRRETRCLRMQLKRLLKFVLPLLLPTALWRLLGRTSAYAFQKSVYKDGALKSVLP